MASKKAYFISDLHLGIDARLTSLERERKVVKWLDDIHPEMEALYLLGDIFDHWFEYGTVVPKGFNRILGKLAEITDDQIPVYYFTGNHDMWMFRYVTDEMGIPVYREPVEKMIQGRQFLLGHGDGIGPGDHGYKFIKKIFSNPACQWAFARLHPNLGIRLMKYFSGKSRDTNFDAEQFLGPDQEWLIQYCEAEINAGNEPDYFVFGHRHLPICYHLSNGRSIYFNLGDWLVYETYGICEGGEMQLYRYGNPEPLAPITNQPVV